VSEKPVDDRTASDTRTKILKAALELFGRRGYQRTSVREIADRVGLTKTAVLYHFTAKADILAALAEPLIDDLESAVIAAPRPDPLETRWAVVEDLLEVYLAHRQSLRMILQDLAMFTQGLVFQRFVTAMTTANHLVAGPNPDLGERVRAAQVIAMLSDPVILLADAPTESLRREVLSGVRRLLGEPAPTPEPGTAPESGTAPPRRSGGGRPSAMSPEMIDTARRMQASGSHTMAGIATALGVSRATLYRHLSPPASHY
jgi:AcrR family transcriptional regulator